MNPKVSVIIPVYNVEKYLRQCLNSVINQTLEDIEIICVDDKSTDSSLNILKEYAQKDCRIKILEQNLNKGQGIARNRALNEAKGDYIMFLDSDDWYELNACEKAYKHIEEYNNDVCIFAFYDYWQDRNIKIKSQFMIEPYKKYKNNCILGFEKIDNNFIRAMFSVMYIYKREFLNLNNIRYSEDRIGEDVIFLCQIYTNTQTLSFIEEPLYNYRHVEKKEKEKGSSLDTDMWGCIFKVRRNGLNIILDKNCYNLSKAYLIYCICSITYRFYQFSSLNKRVTKKYYKSMREFFLYLDNTFDISVIKNYIDYGFFTKVCKKNWNKYIFGKFLENIFSLTNSNNHKIIKILGIKLKIKLKTRKKETIDIVMSADDNYAQHCSVLITSILLNNKSNYVFHFHIIDGEITDKNKKLIEKAKSIKDFEISYYNMTKYDFSFLPLNRHWISITTYYRLFLTEILPTDIQKIIYLDCDIVADGDLSELWETNIDNEYAAVVEDEASAIHAARLGLNNYFNAGVILLNIEKLRESDFRNLWFEYYYKNKDRIYMQDQDILNGVFNNNIKFVSLKWNANTKIFTKLCASSNHFYTQEEERFAQKNRVLIHYTGTVKPWNFKEKHPLRYLYYCYLLKSPFKNKIFYYLYSYLKYMFNRNIKNIFSLKNSYDKSHKIITILGIKVKIKVKNSKVDNK